MKTATLLTGCLVLATSCATSPPAARQAPSATAPARQTVTPVTTSPTKGPEPVKPTGDAINVHKIRWSKAKSVSHGKKVQLTWWSGVAPCTVLHKVKVKETAKKVTITLYEGTSPKAENVSCIMIAVQKTTTVKLKHPLAKRRIVDGAK
jgi:hypothetical protein